MSSIKQFFVLNGDWLQKSAWQELQDIAERFDVSIIPVGTLAMSDVAKKAGCSVFKKNFQFETFSSDFDLAELFVPQLSEGEDLDDEARLTECDDSLATH